MSFNNNDDLDVNSLMSQVRQAAAAPKPAAPVPTPHRNGNGNGNGKKGQNSADQEAFNQQAIGILRGLSGVTQTHQTAIIEVQKNAVMQNGHLLDHNQRLTEQKERLDRQEETLNQFTGRFAPVYLGRGRLFIKTAHGLPLVVPADDLQITTPLILDGCWDKALTKIYQRFLKNDMAYLEIGTHIGYFSTIAASIVGYRGCVHAFEPNPAAFEYLQENMRLNRCAHIAKMIPQAASNETGTTTFHVFRKNPGSSTLSELPDKLLAEWCEQPVPLEVRCTRLDDYYAEETLQFDFIKIDAEGAEPLIFEGGQNFFTQRIKPETVIAMEFNPPAITGLKRDPMAFARSLFAAGFNFWRIVDGETYEPIASPDHLDPWCISELLLSRRTTLPVG